MFSIAKPLLAKAALVALDHNMGKSLAEILLHDGLNLDVPKAFDEFLNLGMSDILSYDILFIDMSSMSGVRDVVGTLIEMRLEYPSLPVVLISSDFSGDDFGMSRRSICDVSLRSPFCTTSLEIACRQVFINNLKWQDLVSADLSAQAA
jgi:hypothetical protein